jgi:hypothetical protein
MMTCVRRARSEDGCERLAIVEAFRLETSPIGHVGSCFVFELARCSEVAKEAICLTHPF